MNYNVIRNTDLKVSDICFGTWPISGHGMGRADEAESVRTLLHAYEKGITFYDTADMYGFGYAESLLGKAFEHVKEEIVIATKVGMQWDEQGNLRKNLQKDYVIKACEDSLKRLKADKIDLYQLHWPDRETPIEETMEALNKLVNEGKIRYIGVSNFSVDEMKEAMKYLPVVSNQVEYSLLKRTPEEDVIPYARQHQSSILPYKVLGRGILTGKFKGVSHFGEDDWRKKEAIFQPAALNRSLSAVEQLRPIADYYGCSVTQLVIAWSLSFDVVPAVIIGAKKPEQISESCADTDIQLTPKHAEKMNALFKKPNTIESV